MAAVKSVLITGCSKGGIGDALAMAYHRQGLRVFATARTLSKVEHLKQMGIELVPLDVIDQSSISQAVEIIRKATGGTLDILVNNSGSGYSIPLLDANLDTAKDMFDVNVFALVSVTQAFAPLLIASRGTIVNIGSIAGKAPFPFQGLYNASKAAANLLSDQLRIELKPFGVSVILVVTGSVRTKFYDNIPTQTLPDNSVYLPAKKQVELIMSGKMAQQGFDVNEYAESVVRNSLKGSPTVYHWVGTSVSSVWIVSNFLWHTAWDFILPKIYKFQDLTNLLQSSKL